MSGPAQLSPMFRQYHELKRDHPHAILLFRMGDFYEMFYEDARTASALLELTLTARGKGTDHVVPMCGFPHHQLDAYTARLLEGGQKVAICDQVEDPRAARGLVRREVVRVVTPGTITDPGQLRPKENLWLAGVAAAASRLGAAFLDLSTGEFLAWESDESDPEPIGSLGAELRSFAPREIVLPEGLDAVAAFDDRGGPAWVRTEVEPYTFSAASAAALLQRHLGVASLDGYGLGGRPAAAAAAGGLLQYLQDTQRCGLEHINEIRLHEPRCHLLLDPATRRNLELERSIRDGGRRSALIPAVDDTVTAPGGRLLRRWLLAPLLDVAEIARRQDGATEMLRDPTLRADVRDALKGVQDVERLLARTVGGTAGPRDLASLRASLERLPALLARAADLRAPLLRERLDALDPCADVAERLRSALADEPSANVRDGGVIREGFHEELDALRSIRRDGRSYIAALEAREREATGIASLKVRFNKVFGYFIEVSKSNLDRVPAHYSRKQTIAGGERFVTPELKEHESRVLNAQESILDLEAELFQGLRREMASHAARLQAVARVVSLVDVLAAFAETAARGGYVRPVVHDGTALRIVGGRHPVVERNLLDARFVPNDARLDAGGRAIAVITGPNMGGKSTYLRQVAQIVLLAQSGAFVPAEEAEIGIADRIFCRVGASDSLAEGQSTFMVEMAETANILRHATTRSLVLLDEIGRGTSTFDGLSIAWAVVEHLDGLPGGPPRTLFATHYHELTELAIELDGVLNLRLAVREWGDQVVFLHRVEEGAADRSYGIHVARLAGIPAPVVQRAREILSNLERDEYGADGQPRRARRPTRRRPHEGTQPTLFGWTAPHDPAAGAPGAEGAAILAELRAKDPDALTPLDALNLVSGWRERLRGEDEAGGG